MENVFSLSTGGSKNEVRDRAKRRRFTAEYKRRILREAETCTQRGALGALLRREGLYSSQLVCWRQQADSSQRQALAPKRRGPQPTPVNPLSRELAETSRELAKWKKRAARAEALVELQKNVSQILGIALTTSEDDS
jgi:transposase